MCYCIDCESKKVGGCTNIGFVDMSDCTDWR